LARRLVRLYAGLVLYGVSMALMVRSSLGVMPWDVLHQGLARQLGWSLGSVTIVVGALVLLAWGAATRAAGARHPQQRRGGGAGRRRGPGRAGGTLGVVTVVYALTIGPLVHVLLPRLAVAPAEAAR
jgi:uncharacterized membrane protein YczE